MKCWLHMRPFCFRSCTKPCYASFSLRFSLGNWRFTSTDTIHISQITFDQPAIHFGVYTVGSSSANGDRRFPHLPIVFFVLHLIGQINPTGMDDINICDPTPCTTFPLFPHCHSTFHSQPPFFLENYSSKFSIGRVILYVRERTLRST